MKDLSEKEILNILKDDSRVDEFLNTLNGEDIKRYLIYINSKVRNIPNEENDIYRGTMYAGELISPNNDIQNRYFEKLATALKNIEGRKNRATALHYLVNELHLFENGNGRTGRCIFELFTNKEFDFEENDNFSHKDKLYVSTQEFEDKNGIKYYGNALAYPGYLVYKALLENNMIHNPNLLSVTTDIDICNLNGNDDLVYIDSEIKGEFSKQQVEQINLALGDNNETHSIGGLAMLIMQNNKGENEERSVYPIDSFAGWQIRIDKENDDSERTFKNWTKEDYLRALEIATMLKECMLDAMLDIFEHPNNFMFNSDVSVAEVLTTDKGGSDKYPMEELIDFSKEGTVNFENTRILSNINKLKEILNRPFNKVEIKNIKMVEQLGQETLEQQIDTPAKNNMQRDVDYREEKIFQDMQRGE